MKKLPDVIRKECCSFCPFIEPMLVNEIFEVLEHGPRGREKKFLVLCNQDLEELPQQRVPYCRGIFDNAIRLGLIVKQ